MELKKQLLDEIDILRKNNAPLKNSWQEQKNKVPKDQVSYVESALDELEAVLKELISMEEEAGNLLMGQKDEVAKQITKIQQQRRAKGAYQQHRGGYSAGTDDDGPVIDSAQ